MSIYLLPSIMMPWQMIWLAEVFELSDRAMWVVHWFGFLWVTGLMYLALMTDFGWRLPLVSISEIAIGEVGLNEMGTFIMISWYDRSP